MHQDDIRAWKVEKDQENDQDDPDAQQPASQVGEELSDEELEAVNGWNNTMQNDVNPQ